MFNVEQLTECESYMREVRRLIGAAPSHIRPWLHETESALLRGEQEARRERRIRARRVLKAIGASWK
jgi:hypothetical protein